MYTGGQKFGIIKFFNIILPKSAFILPKLQLKQYCEI